VYVVGKTQEIMTTMNQVKPFTAESHKTAARWQIEPKDLSSNLERLSKAKQLAEKDDS
jgi:hypothetical protein